MTGGGSFPSEKTVKTSRMSRVVTFAATLSFILSLGLAVALIVVVVKQKEEDDGDNKPEPWTEGNRTSKQTEQLCLTEGCTLTAARVLSAIDTNVNPCENFYNFACGNWVKHHVIPEDRSSLDIFGVIRDNVQVITKYLLEDPVTEENGTAIQKAKDMYHSCVTLDMIENKGISPAIPLLKEFGGWPLLGNKPGGNWKESTFNLARLLTSLKKYNNDIIIDMSVAIDDKNSTNYIVDLDQGDFGMPGQAYLLDARFKPERDAYHTMAVEIAVQFGADRAVADKDLNDALKLEIDLANISMTAVERRDNTALYNKMTLGDLASTFPNPSSIKFDWMDFAHRQFGLEGVDTEVDETEPVLVRDINYYKRVFAVLNKYSKRTIANYCIWRIMQHRASNLPQIFQDIIEEYEKVVYGVTSSRARWRSCMSYTILQMGAAVGKLFVQEAFDESAKDTALDMIHGIRDAFTEMLEEEAWMNTNTRKAAIEKAAAMREWIGYADDILDNGVLNDIYSNVTVDKDEYFQNVLGNLQRWGSGALSGLGQQVNKNYWSDPPTEVNAMYSFILNNIQFPAGIFQPPFYKKDQPRSMNYGGIGVIIGHEITHGFDDQGSKYDKDGNLKNWWDDSVVHNFLDKTQCIVDQYGQFQAPEFGAQSEKVDGRLTLGENIADNGGLKESFRNLVVAMKMDFFVPIVDSLTVKQADTAYRNWVAKNGDEPLLPGLNFTNNQLFFISFAQNWCNKETLQSYISSIRTDEHSPGTFRVIGTLQNSPDFAKTYSCPLGSYMNPVKKCTVW